MSENPVQVPAWKCKYGHVHLVLKDAEKCDSKWTAKMSKQIERSLAEILKNTSFLSDAEYSRSRGGTRQGCAMRIQRARVSICVAVGHGIFGVTPEFFAAISVDSRALRKDRSEMFRLWPQEFRYLLDGEKRP
jgi:hypothetical protein